jgi:hypothetical protein
MDFIASAKNYLSQGLSVIPIRLDGSKEPAIAWKPYQTQLASQSLVEKWFGQETSGIGVVTGEISGNLTIIDFDEDAEVAFSKFWEIVSGNHKSIADRVMVVRTPRPGYHVWFRQSKSVGGSRVLAYSSPQAIEDQSTDSKMSKLLPKVMIETRGEGAYVIAPGSPLDVHPIQQPYEIKHGEPSSLSPLFVDECKMLFEICRNLGQWKPQHVQRELGVKYVGPPRPGDVFNRHADVKKLLLEAGWSASHESSGDVTYMRRPGKTTPGSSATLGHLRDDEGRPLLYVFSSNAFPFEPKQCYDAFAVLALTRHDGDFSEAAASVRVTYAAELHEAQAAYAGKLTSKCSVDFDGLPYKPFPLHNLPITVHSYVESYSQAIGIDPAYIAVPMLSVLAAAIGGSRSVSLKSSWQEPAIIWTVTIGSVSSGKSPGFDVARRPLLRIEKTLLKVRRQNAALQEEMLAAYEQAKADGEKGIVKPKQSPFTDQVLINDVTMEALAYIASHNSKLLLAVDEFAAFIKQMDQYRPGRDTENWLSAYNGGEIAVNRKKDHERIFVPRVCISVTGTTQPAVAAQIIYNDRFLANGLSARILAARPPSDIVRWSDKEVPPEIDAAMFELAKRLYQLKGGEDEHGPCPINIPCTPDAQELFKKWMDEGVDYAQSMLEPLRSAWLKLRPVAARVALIFSTTHQLIESPDANAMQPVDAHSMASGIEVAKWFGYELERNASGSELRSLHDHFQWIVNKFPGGIDARQLQMGRRQIENAAEAKHVMSQLVKHGFGEMVEKRFIPGL